MTHIGYDSASKEDVWHINFSTITTEGSYYIENAGQDRSPKFTISSHVYENLFTDLLRMLYFQRCGCELEEKYAGEYKHALCHHDLVSLYTDPSVKIELNGGWHDAGDYGRYVSPGAVTIGHLLYAYELFPHACERSLNIPESGNDMPDILKECLYELEWMLKMKFEDGGVSHKTTSAYHTCFVMPEDDELPFFLYPTSSMATADFVACMALSSRVYASYRPELAATFLEAAKKAAIWLEANPLHTNFTNPSDCFTGDYSDACDLDERMWADRKSVV